MKIWNRILSFFLKSFKKTSISPGPYPLELVSKALDRRVFIELYLPPSQKTPWSLLLLNDGQDGPRLSLSEHFTTFRKNHPLMIAAIHAGDRLDEYGTAGRLDYKGRGKKSADYQRFILQELLPHLHRHYPITADPEQVGIAGFSLGALSAVDIAWNYPKVFGFCGIFSGALWWRSKVFSPEHPDADRIIHEQVLQGDVREQRFWLQAGTLDETSDRNQNGIIDAINDSLHLMDELKTKIPAGDKYLKYVEVEGGRHEPQTWGAVFPAFLAWAFPKI